LLNQNKKSGLLKSRPSRTYKKAKTTIHKNGFYLGLSMRAEAHYFTTFRMSENPQSWTGNRVIDKCGGAVNIFL